MSLELASVEIVETESNVRTEHMNLDQFNKMAIRLVDGETFDRFGNRRFRTVETAEAQKRYVQYVLTGKHPDTRIQTCIDLDCYRGNRCIRDLELYQDFDSILVRIMTLPYAEPLMLFVWPQKNQTDHKLQDAVPIQRNERVSDFCFPFLCYVITQLRWNMIKFMCITSKLVRERCAQAGMAFLELYTACYSS